MSVHRSLKSRDRLKRQRSVLSRTERIEALATEEKWEDGDSVFGLPKVRVFKTKRRIKGGKKEQEGADAAVDAAGAPAAEGGAAAASKPGDSAT